MFCFFFFKQKTAYEISLGLVGSEMCIRDRPGLQGYLPEHIEQKKKIYERYREGFKDLPVEMNPFDASASHP